MFCIQSIDLRFYETTQARTCVGAIDGPIQFAPTAPHAWIDNFAGMWNVKKKNLLSDWLCCSNGKRTLADYIGNPAEPLYKWTAVSSIFLMLITLTVTCILCYVQRNVFPMKGRNLFNVIGQFSFQFLFAANMSLQYFLPCAVYFFAQTLLLPISTSFLPTRVCFFLTVTHFTHSLLITY